MCVYPSNLCCSIEQIAIRRNLATAGVSALAPVFILDRMMISSENLHTTPMKIRLPL